MSARTAFGLIVFSLSSVVQAEVTVELVPNQPGPYMGGESLAVDVWLHSEVSSDESLVGIRFDFQDSDPMLSLGPTFTFDFSSISPAPVAYDTRFTELPVPWTENPSMCLCPELFLWLPAAGSLHIGSFDVQLPTELGVYRVDLLNADEVNPTFGALIHVGVFWTAYTGEITGGAYEFRVGGSAIPTVSTWGLTVLTLLLLIGAKVHYGRRAFPLA